jgi:3-oxoacyl-[acyl-carrier-protein] synthase-3
MTTKIKSIIAGTGSYLPEKIVTNSDLEKLVDTTDEWIFQRSGIRERRVAAENEVTSDMAIKAALSALHDAGMAADQIDGIIVATTTGETAFPSVAVRVQSALGINAIPAFDVGAACSGFIYALSTADAFIRAGNMRRVLVIGAEKMTSILDWSDRTTCVLFADGAGAVVLEARDVHSDAGIDSQGIHSTHIHANGEGRNLLYTDGGVTSKDHAKIVMLGKEVFKYAVEYLSSVVTEVLETNNITPDQIDWLVPHQANIRIIESTAKKLHMGMDRVITTVERHGNTSAASIPLALDEGIKSGKIKRGELVLLEAMGAGFTWGAALVRY